MEDQAGQNIELSKVFKMLSIIDEKTLEELRYAVTGEQLKRRLKKSYEREQKHQAAGKLA